MVEAFGSQGIVRVSPLHVHGPGDIARFLRATREIAKTTPVCAVGLSFDGKTRQFAGGVAEAVK